MYNLLQYSDNYSIISGSLLDYYRDKLNDDQNENENTNNRTNNNKTITSKYFKCKTKLIGSKPNEVKVVVSLALHAAVFVPLKYLTNIWRFLDFLLITVEIELDLSWLKEWITSKISRTPEVERDYPLIAIQITVATFQIIDTKLYVPVDTLSINSNIKLL